MLDREMGRCSFFLVYLISYVPLLLLATLQLQLWHPVSPAYTQTCMFKHSPFSVFPRFLFNLVVLTWILCGRLVLIMLPAKIRIGREQLKSACEFGRDINGCSEKHPLMTQPNWGFKTFSTKWSYFIDLCINISKVLHFLGSFWINLLFQ